ncbi:uncharacterized protein K452DRAFT_272103 [Neofusicoccum parvum]|nr:uncharacterized protein K452DRAFT_272103 [Neofusicoccum parvum]
MARIFFIGGTGHIGGEVINAIVKRFPDVEVVALVRDEGKAIQLKSSFPTINTIIGDLSSLSLIEEASRDAGIVINTGPDITHAATTAAISRGLTRTPSSTTAPQPTFLIHTSGGGLTWTPPTGRQDPSHLPWSDTLSTARIISAPGDALHAVEDAAVRRAGSAPGGPRVAIISPTIVYGLSASPGHAVPASLPDMVAAIEGLGGGFAIGDGSNRCSWVHVADIALIYVALLADALGARGGGGGEVDERLWGPDAYYFGADEEVTFREWMGLVVPALRKHGLLGRDGIVEVAFEDVVQTLVDAGSVSDYADWRPWFVR